MYNSPAAPREHPRLFFTRADLTALRGKMAHPDCRGAWERLLAACEAMVQPDPDRLYPRFIRPSHMAFAYLMTGRREFADKAREMSFSLVARDTWSSAGDLRLGWKAGLATGAAISETALTYDWLYDLWTDAERNALREAIRDKGLAPYLDDMRHHARWIEWYTCNGMCVVNGPVLMAALLLEAELDTREALDFSLEQIRRAIDAHCRDGGYPEGPLYWNYCLRHMLLGVEPLRRLKGIDLYREPFLHTTCNYPLHFILPDLLHVTNIADSYADTHLWAPVAALAAYHRNPEFQWLARRLITHDWGLDGEGLEYSLFFLIYYDPALMDREPASTSYLFGGLQQVSWRTGWDRDAVHVAWLNGPSNCHHNHLHLNSFTLSAFGERLLVECGKFDYGNSHDYRKQTAGHNSLLVNGEGQIITTNTDIFCRRVRAGEWGTVFGEFRCLRQEAGLTIGTGATVNAYAGRLRTFDRTLAFAPSGFLFLHDAIELAQTPPATLQWLFHSGGTLALEDHGALFASAFARMRLVTYAHAPLRAAIGNDHYDLEASPFAARQDGQLLPYVSLTADCTGPTFDLFALLVPFPEGEAPTLTLQPAEDGVLFGTGDTLWRYDVSRRTVARLNPDGQT